MTDRVPNIKSLSGSTKDRRCLEVWFEHNVTDADRAWLLEAVNQHMRNGARDRTLSSAERADVETKGSNQS